VADADRDLESATAAERDLEDSVRDLEAQLADLRQRLAEARRRSYRAESRPAAGGRATQPAEGVNHPARLVPLTTREAAGVVLARGASPCCGRVVGMSRALTSMEVLPVDDRPSEPDGFREFVDARSGALLRSGWLLTGDWPSAEDLVQTALAAAWPRWASLTRQDAPELYVRKIMVNTFLRWRQRRWNGEIATGRLPEMRAYGDAFAQIDARQALIAALDRLPPRQRAVVVLRYFADQTEAQTAAAMGCSVGAVKAHASKALARLRDAPGLAELMTGGVTS
jgi:RNA polymerase sigma-70 factor (sigma-E family)